MNIFECLEKVVNDELLFDFAIEHICEKETDQIHTVAGFIATLYVIKEFEKQGKVEFTEEEINQRISELMADRVLFNLQKKGLVEVDFSDDGKITYGLTPIGHKVAHSIAKDNK